MPTSLRCVLAVVYLFVFTPSVMAAPVCIDVTNSAESGANTLRAAILAGNALSSIIELPENTETSLRFSSHP